MSVSILEIVVDKCRRPGSFNAHRLVRHLQHLGPEAQKCFSDDFVFLAGLFNENKDQVDEFCDAWIKSRNPDTIMWVTKAALTMQHTFLLETIRDSLIGLKGDINLDQTKRDFVVKLIGRVESETCDLSRLTEACRKLLYIGVPRFEKYAPRPDDERELRNNLKVMAENPEQNGVALVLGGGGNGKSSILSNFVFNKANLEFFMDQCNIQTFMWLNCYRWNVKFDRQSFFNALIDLGRQGAKGKDWKEWNSVQQMVDYYYNVLKQRIMFIFDDCFNGEILTTFRSVAIESPCCAITRYREFLKTQVPVVGPSEITGLQDDAIVSMLSDTYGLNELSRNQLIELAKRCVGSPLVASLWAGLFQTEYGNPSTNFDKLMKFGIKEIAHDELPNILREEERTAHALYRAAIEKLKPPTQFKLMTFLLVDPVEPIAVADLEKVWNLTAEETKDVLQTLLGFNLIRQTRISRDFLNKEDAVLMHQVLHEATLDKAKSNSVYSNDASLAYIRISLIGEFYDNNNQPGQRLSIGTAFVHSLNNMVQKNLGMFIKQVLTKFERGDFSPMAIEPVIVKISEAAEDTTGWNMLHYAAACVNDESLTSLIVRSSSSQKISCNEIVPQENEIETPDIVRKHDNEVKTPLTCAAMFGHLNVVEYLLQQCPDAIKILDIYGRPPLAWAAVFGHLNVVDYLHQQWPDAISIQDTHGITSLALAAYNSHLNVVEYLLRQRPDAIRILDIRGRPPLAMAAMKGHLNVVEYLHKQWPDAIRNKDQDGKTPLALATLNGHQNVVEYLLRQWPEAISIVDIRGRPPLALAAMAGYLNVVEYLFRQWPDALKMQDKQGLTPLACAVFGCHHDVAEYLRQQWPEVIDLNTLAMQWVIDLNTLDMQWPEANDLNTLAMQWLETDDEEDTVKYRQARQLQI